MGRLIAIGDIHGCAKTLTSMIDQLMVTHEDTVVFMGDYVDRGDGVFSVIEQLIEFKEMFPNTVFIKGNHEDMFIRYLKGEGGCDNARMFKYNGGTSTINNYLEHLNITDTVQDPFAWDKLPVSHQEFYDNLKVMYEHDQYVFVHAGVRPQVHLADQLDHDMIWIRDEFLHWPLEVLKDRVVVHGHTPMDRAELEKYNNKYGDKFNLDSACVFGVELTAMDLLTGVVWRIPMLDKRVA
jgi:serine/threonine protein phosphatase 1